MDTSGHRELSIVGEELLKPALEKANHKGLRIGAFYLGNWLTDVSQCVDARAYKAGKIKAAALIDDIQKLFESFLDDVPSWIPEHVESVGRMVNRLRNDVARSGVELRKQLEAIVGEGSNGQLAKAFHSVFRFKGFFKFVAAEDGSTDYRMDPAAYFKVFDNRYGEYFPHEHLDRPETTPDHYDTRTGAPPFNKWTKLKAGAPGVYTYLREDIKIASGLLAYLDAGVPDNPPRLSWAAATFHTDRTEFTDQTGNQQAVDDKNYEWNRHLALLGHAMHAIEDFYAHSTFVEHACAGVGDRPGLPDSYQRFQRHEEQEVLARRLKRWAPGLTADKDWKKAAKEPEVVTGYFDIRDTVVSLSHVLEELLDRPRDPLGRSVDDLIDYKYSKLLKDTLDLGADPKKVWQDPANDPKHHGYDEDSGNMAVKILREKGGRDLRLAEGNDAAFNEAVRFIADAEFKDVPPEVREDYIKSVKTLGRVVGTGKMAISLYKLLKDVAEFFTNPLAWFKNFLPKVVWDFLKKYGEVYLEKKLLEYVGANRIGCHSLIAKDSGPELLHAAAMECAKAVHWYVVHALTRHSNEKKVAVGRSDGTLRAMNNLYQWEWIDWLEILEYFLSHPYTTASISVGVRTIAVDHLHVTRNDGSAMSPDTLASLAREYQKDFVVVPGGPSALTWDVVADANFPTAGMTTAQRQRQINAVFRYQRTTGLKVKDGINYAYRPGVRVVIPYQKGEVPKIDVPDIARLWWYPVIVDGWKTLSGAYVAGKASPKSETVNHQWIPIAHRDVITLCDDSEKLTKQLEKMYRQ